MATHSLITTLKNLKGNARGCVYTELLWGIPFQLYAPFVSVYMLSFGLKDSQIGLIVSIGLAFQVLMALLSGAITDKLGRKRTTLVFDILSWSIPTLIWAIAQNFTYFLVAAAINSMWRITMNSWSCLLVEDTEQDQLMDIYAWIYISGLLVAFVAPLAKLLVDRFTLVPTVRGLYLFASVMMTIKFVVMNGMVTETRQGLVRMQESRQQSFYSLLGGYGSVLSQIVRSPQTLIALGIMLVMSIYATINNAFWPIIVTEKLAILQSDLSLYATARSLTQLALFFLVLPRVRWLPFKFPMLAGFAGFMLSHLVLVNLPPKSFILLLISVMLEACSFATVGPQIDRMVAVVIDAKERARILSILYMVMIVLTTPFGWLAGALSEINRVLPFFLTIGLFAIGGLLTYLAAQAAAKKASIGETAGDRAGAV